MTIDPVVGRPCRRFALALGLAFAAAAANAQTPPPAGISYDAPPSSGVSYDAPPPDAGEPASEAPPAARPRRAHGEIHPYLEVAQVVSADLDGGETLTYTTVSAGVDGRIQTRRVTAQVSYRYDRNIEWDGDVGDQDVHSGIAQLNAQIVPGAVQFDAGALATRTGGEGRAFGVTDRDESVEVYGAYVGPTVSTHAGPVAVNAAYRLGYVAIDDDSLAGGPPEDFDSSIAHSATASVGMSPGELPIGWTVGAGYARTDDDGEFDHEFEARYVRGDVVVPVSPTLALTAGVGYEDIEANQLDIARDADGDPILDPSGRPSADPSRPRLLTYDLDGIMYDAGVIWRPSPRTELQARAGHRYGGTTVVGSLAHQFSPNSGMNLVVFDTVETLGSVIINDLSNLPDDFDISRDPLTGGLGGCVFGSEPGSGLCLQRDLQSIRGNTFRARGVSLVVSGERGLWSWGAGAGYAHRRFARPRGTEFDVFGGSEDEVISLYGSVGRELSRDSELGFNAYASWFDSDFAGSDEVFSAGATLSYNRRLLLDRLRLLAALGLYHADDGTLDSTVASGLVGLRYTF